MGCGGGRGLCGLEKEWTGLSSNEMWRRQRTVWPGERMDRAELEWDVEEAEDCVAWRKNGQG